jgi:hypothetical protein
MLKASDKQLLCSELLDSEIVKLPINPEEVQNLNEVDDLGKVEEDKDDKEDKKEVEETDLRLKRTPKKSKIYKIYTNKEKIAFLNFGGTIGYKRAALMLKICWSTAKSWINKSEELKKENVSYTYQLLGIFVILKVSSRRKN